jgi:hypothetical protein
MADDKITHFEDPPTRQDFPETKDKIVEIVEITAEPDYYGITIRFQDKTALTFVIEPCVVAFLPIRTGRMERKNAHALSTHTQQNFTSVTGSLENSTPVAFRRIQQGSSAAGTEGGKPFPLFF